jgi:hypothetical protein
MPLPSCGLVQNDGSQCELSTTYPAIDTATKSSSAFCARLEEREILEKECRREDSRYHATYGLFLYSFNYDIHTSF